ncbi:isochorismatase family protein [Schaalia suimastitidis]|uniref:isochorismatase family protein n=1 Tax=Schaalia suimastitidis TaxID=121163 RepID=UPI00041E8FE3|nr:isochorismatase family protein [Schaalia suimastitidis]
MSRALIVVDVQPTFCENGELPVIGGNACAERIAAYIAAHRDSYALIATTQDWHIEPGAHFSHDPDYIDTWPPHGVAGTANAELHPALAQLNADATIRKGQYSAAYSGFEGTSEDGRSLSVVLHEAGIRSVDIVGLAESHCVCDTALDAVRAGFATTVFTDLTEPVSAELGRAARERMSIAGVRLVNSK